jgi:hypothetical protein
LRTARSLLLDDLLGDFPFTSEAERAHALALLLLPFVRPLIEGPTPLHLVEKPMPGTGATLLVDAIAVVATGHSASIMTEGRDEEEWRKRITAKLREAPLMVVIDNLRRPLDAAPVAAALTAPYWEDRILGRSDIIRIPVRCAWVATGNNPQLSNEIARRAVRIRLDAHMDRPWQRDGFRHPNLLTWVHAHRGSLVSACLTLGRAWVEAGRPRDRRATLGSFESWSETMGGILDVAGVPGFLANAEELYELSDAEGTLWRSFVAAWWDRFGTAEVGVGDLYELAVACEPPLPLGAGNERSQRIRLGKALARIRDRVFQIEERDLRVAAAGILHKSQRWVLVLERERNPASSRAGSSGDVGDVGDVYTYARAGSGGDVEACQADIPTNIPTKISRKINDIGDVGDVGDVYTYARANAYACVKNNKEKGEKHPQPPQHPQTHCWDEEISGGCAWGCSEDASQHPHTPDWLKEVL